jgi:hypothetical protein
MANVQLHQSRIDILYEATSRNVRLHQIRAEVFSLFDYNQIYDFNSYTVGQQPPDYTSQWNPGVGSFTVENKTGSYSGKALKFTPSVNNHAALVYTPYSGTPQTDVINFSALVSQESGSNNNVGIASTITGTTSERAAVVSIKADGKFSSRFYSSGSKYAEDLIDYPWETDEWYWVSMEKDNRHLWGKVWHISEPEPEEWMVYSYSPITNFRDPGPAIGFYNYGSHGWYDQAAVHWNRKKPTHPLMIENSPIQTNMV